MAGFGQGSAGYSNSVTVVGGGAGGGGEAGDGGHGRWFRRTPVSAAAMERRRYGGGKLEVSRRHSFVVRPRASVCGRVARAGRHELSASVHGIGARQQELARLGSAWLGLAV
uniref:Uncharacterized protein n=1 Tax=Oryza rufipogon TaxID=4529 RepID=A0A0E0NY91_ORYRU